MAKKVKEQPKLWEGFPHELSKAPVNEGPLVPPRRANPWPYIVPLVLIIAVLAGAYWAYMEYLAPVYAEEKSSHQSALSVAEEYEGEIVQKKEQEPNCYSLKFNREDTIHSLCVSEELWNEQEQGKPFNVELLRNSNGNGDLTLPWKSF